MFCRATTLPKTKMDPGRTAPSKNVFLYKPVVFRVYVSFQWGIAGNKGMTSSSKKLLVMGPITKMQSHARVWVLRMQRIGSSL